MTNVTGDLTTEKTANANENRTDSFGLLKSINIGQLNEENLHSELVKQDVLILSGRKDHFIPFKMHKMQVKALTNAKSVTARVFTKEEHAQNHCQIGNIGLALDTMIDWIEKKS